MLLDILRKQVPKVCIEAETLVIRQKNQQTCNSNESLTPFDSPKEFRMIWNIRLFKHKTKQMITCNLFEYIKKQIQTLNTIR